MRTICQHIFDLARNSINAEAQNIQIIVEEDIPNNIFKLIVIDDGRGIKPEILTKVKQKGTDKKGIGKRRTDKTEAKEGPDKAGAKKTLRQLRAAPAELAHPWSVTSHAMLAQLAEAHADEESCLGQEPGPLVVDE